MDRLPTVAALAVLLAGSACGGGRGDAKPKAGRARVNAVAAAPQKQVKLEEWCESYADADTARPFAFPELADGASVAAASGWRWVNVWATWCKPCIEELPMLDSWQQRLSKDRVAIELAFLSVDADAPTVAKFRETHPQTPGGPRIKDVEALPTWLASLGLDESSVLPIHLFVDPKGKLRCVRMGGVGEDDYGTVRRIVEQGA